VNPKWVSTLYEDPQGEEGEIVSTGITSFQERVEAWLDACFPQAVRSNRSERTHRFLEEALELAQANGCSRADALALVDYVFGRPQGDPVQEVGGVMVTLASLCSATGLNMDQAGDIELSKNWDRIEVIREKQRLKPIGSPLPQ
jgi:hypothetical protein